MQVGRAFVVNFAAGLAVLALLALAGVVGLFIPVVQDALRPALQKGLEGLSPAVLLGLAVGLPLLAAGLGGLARWLWARRARLLPGRAPAERSAQR